MEAVYEMATLLNTGLDRETLGILMALLQKGINPEALASVVIDLREEARVIASRAGDKSTRSSSGTQQETST